jgi:hypothetical protein
VERQPILVHLRSESGPNLTRFALGFAPYGGGDVLWLAYVPEGLRPWFEKFAASCDPDPAARRLFRVVRRFDAPGLDAIEVIADTIRRRLRGTEKASPEEAGPPAPVEEIVDEVEAGRLHPTAIILEFHHLPILTKMLRTDAVQFARRHHLRAITPSGSPAYAVARLRALLAKLRAAGLHVVVATPAETPADRVDAAGSLDALVLATIEEEADLSLIVDAAPPRDGRFQIRVHRARHPDLIDRGDQAPTSWGDLLDRFGWGVPWGERLQRTCPRIVDVGAVESTPDLAPPEIPAKPGNVTEWVDETEEEFVRWAEARGWRTERASPDQDRGEHWDVAIRRGKERYRVDVKGRSRLRRSDPDPQDTWHWVELRGVVDDGWLFDGQADFIAFQTPDSFLLVPRRDLEAHVRHHVDPEALVSRQGQAEYRVYHRRDDSGARRATGPDRGVLTLVPVERLRELRWDEAPPGKPARRRRGGKAIRPSALS